MRQPNSACVNRDNDDEDDLDIIELHVKNEDKLHEYEDEEEDDRSDCEATTEHSAATSIAKIRQLHRFCSPQDDKFNNFITLGTTRKYTRPCDRRDTCVALCRHKFGIRDTCSNKASKCSRRGLAHSFENLRMCDGIRSGCGTNFIVGVYTGSTCKLRHSGESLTNYLLRLKMLNGRHGNTLRVSARPPFRLIKYLCTSMKDCMSLQEIRIELQESETMAEFFANRYEPDYYPDVSLDDYNYEL